VARSEEEQRLITDLFERVVLYDLRVTAPTAIQRADGKWDVTVPVTAKKIEVDTLGAEHETPLDERIEVALYSAEPNRAALDATQVIIVERRPFRSGTQLMRFVTDRRPAYAAIDPDDYYIDRNSADNVAPLSP
jgi:hypothetical protein